MSCVSNSEGSPEASSRAAACRTRRDGSDSNGFSRICPDLRICTAQQRRCRRADQFASVIEQRVKTWRRGRARLRKHFNAGGAYDRGPRQVADIGRKRFRRGLRTVAAAEIDQRRPVLPRAVELREPLGNPFRRPVLRLVCMATGASIGRAGGFRLRRIGPSEEMVAPAVDHHVAGLRHVAADALCGFAALGVAVMGSRFRSFSA